MKSSLLEAERASRFRRSSTVIAFTLLLHAPGLSAATTLSDTAGEVFFRKPNTSQWVAIQKGAGLGAGDQLRTGSGARATITFDDGSRVEIGSNSNFAVAEADVKSASLVLSLGSLRAWVSKSLNRQFRVRTPTAVCSVRGTDWEQTVNAQGNTSFKMGTGLLAVADNFKNEVLLKQGDTLTVTDQGMGAVTQAVQQNLGGRRESAKREVGLEMSKEEVQAAAALEAKSAIFKEGKAIIDVNGKRVRIEEYIIRPTPEQFKLVVLNSREARFDYFYYRGTFNQALPTDISIALRQLPGCIGSPCDFFLTGYETARSNTVDNMLEVATGGHLVDVNNNAAGYGSNGLPNDAVTAAFDPATDRFVRIPVGDANVNNPAINTPFFKTLYNTNRLTFNGVEHQSWVSARAGGADIRNTVGDVAYTYTTSIQRSPACGPPDCTYTENGLIHSVVYDASPDGSVWDKFDSYIISNEGKVATNADFSGITSGTQYKETLLKWNFQTIVTASEFQGRKIDLAVEPKIFIQSGLIP